MLNIKDIKSPQYLLNGDVDCYVLFEGFSDYLPYTASSNDDSETGRAVWDSLQSGDFGEITPYEVSPQVIEALKQQMLSEIKEWRKREESSTTIVSYNGARYDVDNATLDRIYPVLLAQKASSARQAVIWRDVDNRPVEMSSSEFENLVVAMSSELATKNDTIYTRQREMKDQVLSASTVEELQSITIGW